MAGVADCFAPVIDPIQPATPEISLEIVSDKTTKKVHTSVNSRHASNLIVLPLANCDHQYEIRVTVGRE